MAARLPLTFYREPLPGVDTSELQGQLIVIEGPDAVGRSTQIALLRQWLEQEGHAVLDSGMARSALAGRGIQMAKTGNTLGPITMTLFLYHRFLQTAWRTRSFRRCGPVSWCLIDRYIYSIMGGPLRAGKTAAGSNRWPGLRWFRTPPTNLRTDVEHLVSRVVMGRGAFDYWEKRHGSALWPGHVRELHQVPEAPHPRAGCHGRAVMSSPW